MLEEVEKQLAKFREDLRKKLLKLPSTLEEQKRLIKYVCVCVPSIHTCKTTSLRVKVV